jgi:hypothetical protein
VETQLDRRKFQRVAHPFRILHAPFALVPHKSPPLEEGDIVNVSAIGVLFQSPARYRAGQMIRVEIRLGSWETYKPGFRFFDYIYQGEPFVALAKVVRADPADRDLFETAAEFVSVDEGHRIAVDRFLCAFKDRLNA